MRLATRGKKPAESFNHAIFQEAMEWLHKQHEFKPEMLQEEPAVNLINETYRVLKDAVDSKLKQSVPQELTDHLEQDTYYFSGFKTYHELREASALLKGDDGTFKPFGQFAKDVEKIDNTYNKSYLYAEYNFAVQSTQMAVKWHEWEKDGDEYDLQYRTSEDDRVRPEHAALDGITLPFSDAFWDKYLPPLGWNCRCTTVQVLKDKYPHAESWQAQQLGEAATSGKGENIFRFNPGKQKTIFPPKHPYLPKGCGSCPYKGGAKLANDAPRNTDSCKACLTLSNHTLVNIQTNKGKVRVSWGQSRQEKSSNIKTATYLANKYGHEIDLLPTSINHKTADAYNKTLGIYQEYKVNTSASKTSIDTLLRKASHQADHIVIRIESDIDDRTLSESLNNRVKRETNIVDVWIIKGNKDVLLSRESIIADNFKIKWD